MRPIQTIENTPINPLTLSFRDRSLEALFQLDYFRGSISRLRWNLLLGCILYAVFGVIDCLIIPEIKHEAWFIRYCLVCPLVIGVYLFTFTAHFEKITQLLLVFAGFAASAGVVEMIIISPSPGSYLYYAGLLLCLMFYYSFVGLRFISASVLSWSTFLLYLIMVIPQGEISMPVLLHNTFVFVSFNITGMWVSYSAERSTRSDFLQKRTIMEQTEDLRIALLDVETARREAEDISRMDPLTNLYNRRHFLSVAEVELVRNSRYPLCMAIIMVDIDYFKAINDTYGHHAGDMVLLSVAENIRNTVRRTDIPCRYGGEEFLILLPETDLHAAAKIGERLRETIEATVIETDKGPILVTASMGISAMAGDDREELEIWIKRADQALYEAKQAGRNKVRIWNSDYVIADASC